MGVAQVVKENNRMRVKYERGLTKKGKPARRSLSIPMLSPDVPKEAIDNLLESLRIVMGYNITGADKIAEEVKRVWGPEDRVKEDEEEETLTGLEQKRRMTQDMTMATSASQGVSAQMQTTAHTSMPLTAQTAAPHMPAAPLAEQRTAKDILALPAHVKKALLRDTPLANGTLYSREETGMTLPEFVHAREVLKSLIPVQTPKEKAAAKERKEKMLNYAKTQQEAKAAQRAEMKRGIAGERQKSVERLDAEKGYASERIIETKTGTMAERIAAAKEKTAANHETNEIGVVKTIPARVISQEEKEILDRITFLSTGHVTPPPMPPRKETIFTKIRDFFIDDSYLLKGTVRRKASPPVDVSHIDWNSVSPTGRLMKKYDAERAQAKAKGETSTTQQNTHQEELIQAPVIYCETGG